MRSRAREQQLTTEVSDAQNWETDYQGALQSLELESDRHISWSGKTSMETNAKDTGRNQNLIHQLDKVGGEKHWPQKELLDLRGSARKQIETNQSGRDANLSMRRELGHTGIESDRLGVELLRSKAESERFDQELRGAQDTIHSWDDSTFHIPEPASGASGEPALCDTVRTLGRKEGSPGSHGVSPS